MRGFFEFFGSPTWTRTRDLRINSPSLYQLSYQGTAEKKIMTGISITVKTFLHPGHFQAGMHSPDQSTLAMASTTASMFLVFSAATQMRPVSTA